jgi:hypothetical protein
VGEIARNYKIEGALQSRQSAELQGLKGRLWGWVWGIMCDVIECTLCVTCSELCVIECTLCVACSELAVGGDWMSSYGSEAEGLAV